MSGKEWISDREYVIHDAEGAVPETVGYTEPWSVIEYGIFEDRRRNGLGFILLKTTGNRSHAERLLTDLKNEREYPRFLRERGVVYQPWARVHIAREEER